jgi:monooxygenase
MSTPEELDVVIIGAGLSGIGAAVHLQQQCPHKNVAILEGRANMGGTWDLFRYPGIRSDSDMLTLGYRFKPWRRKQIIADGSSIRDYIREAAREYGLDRKIRYQHRVRTMDWCSRTARWTLTIDRPDQGDSVTLESRFVICCAGYYRYDSGYTPNFPGRQDFAGTIIHPQHWLEDFDYRGQRMVVIGSGATAITLAPALADKADQVVMLQRSPGYVFSLPQYDAGSETLRGILPERTVYALGRARNMVFQMVTYNVSRLFPRAARQFLMKHVQRRVGDQVDMTHFDPDYNPWDQRLCVAPDGDFLEAVRDGRITVVTDHIERFTRDGIQLQSGRHLEADTIITATGLRMQMLGGLQLSLDGQPVDIAQKYMYKGAMLEDVPNFVTVFGYTNSSWTLKAELISDYACRVLRYMDEHDYAICVPRNHDPDLQPRPFVNLSAGYVLRAQDELPRQAQKEPWRVHQNYLLDLRLLRYKKVDDGVLVFTRPVTHGYGYPDGESFGWLYTGAARH